MDDQSYYGIDPAWGNERFSQFDDEEAFDTQPSPSPFGMAALSQSLPLYGGQDQIPAEFSENPYGHRTNSVGSWCAPGMLGSLSESHENSRRTSGSSPYYNNDSNPTTLNSQQISRRQSTAEAPAFIRVPVRRDSHSVYHGLGSNFDIPEDTASQPPMRPYPSSLDTQGLVGDDMESRGPSSPGLMRMSLQPGDNQSWPPIQTPDSDIPRRRDSFDSQPQQRAPHRSHSKRSKPDAKKHQHGAMPRHDRYPQGEDYSKSVRRDDAFRELHLAPVDAQTGTVTGAPLPTAFSWHSSDHQFPRGDDDHSGYTLHHNHNVPQEGEIPRMADHETGPYDPIEESDHDESHARGTDHATRRSRMSSSRNSNRRR